MSSLYEAKLLKNKKWKTIEALTRFSLCKPNIIQGRQHNRTYVQFQYKSKWRLTWHHFLASSDTLSNSGSPDQGLQLNSVPIKDNN